MTEPPPSDRISYKSGTDDFTDSEEEPAPEDQPRTPSIASQQEKTSVENGDVVESEPEIPNQAFLPQSSVVDDELREEAPVLSFLQTSEVDDDLEGSPLSFLQNGIVDDEREASTLKFPDEEIKCGVNGCYPGLLQPFASVGGYMTLFAGVAVIQGIFFSYFIAVISTIEKRFGIRSRTTGLVMSGEEISQILFSIVLSHYGGQGHRPRWIAFAMFTIFVSSVLLASPHFLLGPGELIDNPSVANASEARNTFSAAAILSWREPEEQNLCKSVNTAGDISSPEISTSSVADVECVDDDDATVGMWLLFFAHFITGIGISIFYPLNWSFYDDNVDPKHAPFFHGFSFAVRIVGPFLGFVLAYVCLQIYVIPGKDPGISPSDPRWLGAWWLGFVAVGTVLLVFAVTMALFPRRIPTRYSNDQARKKSISRTVDAQPDFLDSLKGIPSAVKRLVTNKIFMFNLTSGGLHLFAIFGFFSFAPKYMESQFRVTAAQSSLGSGFSNVLVQIFGVMGSGILFRKYRPSAKVATSFIVFVSALSGVGYLAAMSIGCPTPGLQGEMSPQGLELTTECNRPCGCSPLTSYDPVCSKDGKQYFSPCHAGCHVSTTLEGREGDSQTIYEGCLCVDLPDDGSVDALDPYPGEALKGICQQDGEGRLTCGQKYAIYLIVLGVVEFIASTSRVIGLMIPMRSVENRDKPIALAFMVTVVAIFSTIPAPILYGSVVDSTCLVWKDSKCGGKANCAVYDTDSFRFHLHSWTAALTFLAIVFEVMMVRLSHKLDLYGDDEDNGRAVANVEFREFVDAVTEF